jgi:tRNA nucleotidyltransferase (CCA-adding enzyme)
MKSNKIQEIIQKDAEVVIRTYPMLTDIFDAIQKEGGHAYFVGGMVRDMFLRLPLKDIDIEVHGLQEEQLTHILQKFGHVDTVGKSFGVLRLHGVDIDWSLPRADSSGRKPTVAIDPFMPIDQALVRRDVTINAMAVHVGSLTLIDPFGGLQDIQNGILRSPNIDFFAQDPLRFFRVMSFISRFEMYPDPALHALCEVMSFSSVSRERIELEFAKMLLRSKRPSLGIRWLKQIGRLQELLPELAACVDVQQSPKWHPEGDVFEHSMQALDAAAQLEYATDEEKLTILYAALCHDLGKAETTKHEADGIHSHGHETAGEPLAKSLLKRITHNKDLIDNVARLVRLHMEPVHFMHGNARPSAYKRLAHKLAPELNIAMLLKLATADRRGRNGESSVPLHTNDPDLLVFAKNAELAKVTHHREPPLLTGKDFLDVIAPGPQLGRAVSRAYELQIEGETDPVALRRKVLDKLSHIKIK